MTTATMGTPPKTVPGIGYPLIERKQPKTMPEIKE
jgi:hypothetical protein